MNLQAIFGRYISVSSPVHQMDPRIKIILCVLFVVDIFVAQSYVGLLICALFIIGMYGFSHISIKQAVISVLPLCAIVVLVALLNIFFVQGGEIYFQFWVICISQKGIEQACFLAVRLFLLLVGLSLLTLTTTTLDITDGFESLLSPLKKLHFPIHELAMVMGIALRFLPEFALELQTIYRAQLSRGAKISNNLKGYLTLLSSLLVPLFTSAFRHAETLSLAMDARCYHGGEGRTKLIDRHISHIDIVACVYMIIALLCVIAINIIYPYLLSLF